MNSVVVIFAFVAVVYGHDEMRKCGKIFGPESKRCCTQMAPPEFDTGPLDEIKECFDIPMRPRSCERDECIAKKKGYYSEDGGIDGDAIMSTLEKDFEKDPELWKNIKENCIKGDLNKYGMPDMCDLTKLRHCLHVQLLSKCTEWDDTADCAGMRELVEECTSNLQ